MSRKTTSSVEIFHVSLIVGAKLLRLFRNECRLDKFPLQMRMKHICAKPSAQLSKHMHILHCCYKLVDNHLDIVPVCKLKQGKPWASQAYDPEYPVNHKNVHCIILCNQPAVHATCASIVPGQQFRCTRGKAKKLTIF